MYSKWTKTGRVEEVLDCHAPRGPRIIALVFLAPFAVFFGYYLAASLVEYIPAASPHEWLRALPGLLVVLALFLSFGIPSWWLLLGRTRLIFERGGGRILQVFDFRIYRRTKAYRVDDIILVNSMISRSGNKASTPGTEIYAVQVHFREGKPITVAHEERAGDARDVAARITALLPAHVVGPPGARR
ncbi:MAG: hypothetical protein ACOY3O_14725 [Thermodesulfobacteriota bacterium]